MKRISIRNRLLLSVGVILLVSFITLETVTYLQIKASRERSILLQAQSLRDALIAMRRVFHQQFVASELPLNDKTIGFIPGHAMGRISETFSQMNPDGVSFNNVSDSPRNARQKADALELAAMEYFRAQPHQPYYFRAETGPQGEEFYLYAQPIWVEKYCLKCHGKPENAPETIRQRYETTFGYHVGELRGLLSIKIPNSLLQRRTQESFAATFAVHLVVFLALVALLLHSLQVFFSQPLEEVSQRLQLFAQGDYQAKAPAMPLEYVGLEQAFNQMAEAVSQRDQALHQAREELESRVVQRTLELQEAIRAKDRFFSLIAHDLKGPVSGLSYLLRLMETTEGETPNPALQAMVKSAEGIQALLENLLTWARSQSGRLELHPREFYLGEPVQDVTDLLSEVFLQKGVFLQLEVAPDLVVFADREIISLVLRNLLSNAVKYSHPGQTVWVQAQPQGNGVLLEVIDQGLGMPPELVASLFQIDGKTPPRLGTANERGTGLGLILVGEFLQRSGGRVEVESALNQGTRIKIWLPGELGASPQRA